MLALVLSLLAPTAQAACPAPTPPSELTANVDDAILSFATLDEEGFIEASDAIANDLPCLSEILGQSDAASIHRAFAMRAFWDGSDSDATAFFSAARRIEPSHVLSDKIAPEGGPLATLYAAANAGDGESGFRAPSWTTVYMDGERASRRPDGVPTLVQYEVGSEGIVWSGMVASGEDLPSLDAARSMRGLPAGTSAAVADATPEPEPTLPAEMTRPPEPEPVPDPVANNTTTDAVADASGALDLDADRGRDRAADRGRDRDGGGGGKGALIGATVATGVVAAGLFGVSAYSRSQFDAIPSESRYNLTNATFFGSVGAAAVTAGLLGATIAVK